MCWFATYLPTCLRMAHLWGCLFLSFLPFFFFRSPAVDAAQEAHEVLEKKGLTDEYESPSPLPSHGAMRRLTSLVPLSLYTRAGSRCSGPSTRSRSKAWRPPTSPPSELPQRSQKEKSINAECTTLITHRGARDDAENKGLSPTTHNTTTHAIAPHHAHPLAKLVHQDRLALLLLFFSRIHLFFFVSLLVLGTSLRMHALGCQLRLDCTAHTTQ
jgi:hypothetical protein